MEQVIYSRVEFPTKESARQIFKVYGHLPAMYNDNNVQIGGVSVLVRTDPAPAVIMLSYDEEADCYIKLAYGNLPGAIYTNLRESNI